MGNFRFHLLFVFLLGGIGYTTYLLIATFHKDYRESRNIIEKESFKSVQQHIRSARASDEEMRYFNPAVVEHTHPAAAPPSHLVQEGQIENVNGEDFWCRPVASSEARHPVRCVYSNSCFQCRNSSVIPPDVEVAVPFCEDGTKAEVFNVECCPTDIQGAHLICPPIRDCMDADNIPPTSCSCDGRDDCHYSDPSDPEEPINCICAPMESEDSGIPPEN